ncbi:MAG TPA: DEAD/DEAH box helicase [Desulfomonilaceae bacterium]|nr:DEAD/DEAH box helicase [Desulfomonilaceae bacterium]
MFGKVIQLKKSAAGPSRGGELPSEITRQFNTEVLERGLKLAEASRISHINFGRESYFGLVTEPSGKSFSAHVTLDPESKVLTRASCACFRSFTRTYCHHIVSFVRYILRPDSETGRLRSLGEDFEDSFWHEISWYGFKNFGDSALGFRCQANHGGEGLRIIFSDRNQSEILSLVPGERLVEEYLHEFFDIVRRDIDPILFRRMYGRKLKDPNVPSLRRRPWQFTESEEEINRRGFKSVRQRLEESIWHRVAKVGFLSCGRSGGIFHFRFLEHKQELIVEAFDEDEASILRLVPPRTHIGSVIEAAEKKGVIGTDLFIHARALKTGYRVDLTESSGLKIVPVVENPDPDASPDAAYLDRTELDQQFFGTYYFFPDWGFFRIATTTGGLPPDHFTPQKSTVIPPDKITLFIEEYGDVLRSDSSILMDPTLLERKTVETYQRVTVDHKEVSHDSVTLEVNYDFGDFQASFREIFEARKNRKRFLIQGTTWIDTMSPEFAWMDGLDEQALGEGNALRVKPTEYLRFLAMHDDPEKRFSSAGVKGWFDGLATLQSPDRIPSIREMKGKLRPYQKNGFGWLWFLYRNGFSGLLCDDMGLGKTHQVMALMSAILHRQTNRSSSIRFLVVCPTTVLSHWHDKVMQYCPHLDPYVYHGTDRSFHEAFDEHLLIVTSYGIALRDIDILSSFRFDLVALDEVQAIKNKSTKTYAAVKKLQSVCTVGLTGTPIENSLTDLKALFDVILPGYLMSDSVFETHFRLPIEEGQDKRTREKFSRMIHPFTLRRKKDQVLRELPPKIEDIRRCTLSEDQIRLYRDVVENQGRDLVQALKDPDGQVPYMHVFAVLNYLKQICNHPTLLEGGTKDYNKYASGKWDLFVELLEESLGSGQKVVVFSQYVKMLELIESFLNDRGIEFATIKGHTRRRAEAVKRFNTDPKCMVFSASLRASGLGIDLIGGSVVIHYDRWWNSAREEQATDRVHRIGQRRGVQVFKLVTEHTLEEKIDTIITRKKRLMDSIVKQDDKSLLKYFSRQDLIELMSF